MSIAFIIILVVAMVVMLVAAIYAITQKDLLQAAIATSVISVALSIMFYIMQAPDVALTEASIGIALSTIIFVITIRNTKRYEEE